MGAELISPQGERIEISDELFPDVLDFLNYLKQANHSEDMLSPEDRQISLIRSQAKQEMADQINAIPSEMISPILLIKAYAELLLDMPEELSEEQRERSLKKIVNMAQLIRGNINLYVLFHRVEANGIHKYEIPSERIVEGIHITLEEFAEHISANNLLIEMETSTMKAVTLAGELLQAALREVLKNAILNTPENGQIHIKLETSPDTTHLMISVKNTGMGILPIDMPYIFKLYYRGQNSLDKSGIGFGLTFAKVVVEAHDGQIWVESAEGQGTSVYIELPIRQA